MNDHQMISLIDEIVKERQARMETGTFCCDGCGDEYATDALVETEDGQLICPSCEEYEGRA